jgi:hypothetical protein
MMTVKDRMVEIIRTQPDDSTYEEILRELAFAYMIERGVDDFRAERIISNEEMKKQIKIWQN